MSELEAMWMDEAHGHFLALADLLREMGLNDMLGRLAELYLEFRDAEPASSGRAPGR